MALFIRNTSVMEDGAWSCPLTLLFVPMPRPDLPRDSTVGLRLQSQEPV